MAGVPFFSTLFQKLKLDPRDCRADREISLVEAHLSRSPAVILDLGCGVGRHARRLAARGHIVAGIDINEQYLDQAMEASSAEGLNVEWLVADDRTFVRALTYDAILSFYTTFGYHCDTENAGVVKNMARSLRHGGIFIVEVFNKEYLGHQTPAVTEEVFGAISLRKLHRFDASSSRLVMDWTYFEAEKEIEKQNFSIRLYSFEEFTALFKAAGLKIRAVYSDTDQRPFDPEGKKLVLVGTPI